MSATLSIENQMKLDSIREKENKDSLLKALFLIIFQTNLLWIFV
jgi:hypothetical protein